MGCFRKKSRWCIHTGGDIVSVNNYLHLLRNT
jgi:hypothetical protein